MLQAVTGNRAIRNTVQKKHKMPPVCIPSQLFLSVTLSTGGAISNMYSVMIARYKFFPEVKTKGMAAAPRLVLFTSEHVSTALSLLY